MGSNYRLIGMVAALVMVGLAIAALRVYYGNDPGGPPAEPDAVAVDLTDRDPTRSGSVAHPRTEDSRRSVNASDLGTPTGEPAVSRAELGEGDADDPAVDTPSDAPAAGAPDAASGAFATSPPAALQARLDQAAAALPEGRGISGMTVSCRTGGSDCLVTGTATTPEDLRAFAEQIETLDAAEGEDAAPTVEINQTQSMSSGMTEFEIGVLY